MNDWLYSDKVKKHFFDPKNAQKKEPKKGEFDATATIGSPVCGDLMQVWLKIDEETEKIQKMTWKTFGCASAIASTSALSQMVKGKTLEQARLITAEDIISELDGLPEEKIHCSVLGDRALRQAINNYYREQSEINKIQYVSGKTINKDIKLTDEDVKDCIRRGGNSTDKIFQMLNLKDGMIDDKEKLREKIDDILSRYGKQS